MEKRIARKCPRTLTNTDTALSCLSFHKLQNKAPENFLI